MATRPSRGRRARFSLRAIIHGWPWYYESTAVYPHEFLLRTVPNSVGYYTGSAPNWLVNPTAFEPAPDDLDGISLFREDFVTKEHLARVNKHPLGARVARIKAKECMTLHLSLKPAPDDKQPPGHVIVPEMPYLTRSQQNNPLRKKIRDLAQQLAQLASQREVYTPPGLPNPVSRSRAK